MSETKIVTQSRKILVDAGAYVEKNHGSQFSTKGRPDLEGCLRGRFFAMEIKVPGKKATPLQEYRMSCVRAAGGYAGVVDDVRQVQAFVREFPLTCRYCIGAGIRIVEGLDQSHSVCVNCDRQLDWTEV